VEGARQILLLLVIEMDTVVGELKEDSSDVTEQSVLGTAIDEVQERVRVTAPVFYDLVRTAAWSKEQDERNTLKDPTKVCALRESGGQPTGCIEGFSDPKNCIENAMKIKNPIGKF